MTTIVTNGKSMAADGRGCSNELIAYDNGVKIVRLSDGSLLGTSGPTFSLDLMAKYLEDLMLTDDVEFPKDVGEFGALHLTTEGKIRLYTGDSKRSYREVDPPFGIGSGRELAMGAMLAGASPFEAVVIASIRDPFTGGKIMEINLVP